VSDDKVLLEGVQLANWTKETPSLELTEDEAKAFLKFLREVPRGKRERAHSDSL
jgi:hypothetical protein